MRKGILVVSFGTSYKGTRSKCIESVENLVKDTFESYEVRRSFTSNFIRQKIKRNENIVVLNPFDALKKMLDEGFKEIIVQPLHIIPGFEYEKIEQAISKLNAIYNAEIKLGTPLLYSMNDYSLAVDAFIEEIEDEIADHVYILMGHGTEHFANANYICLQSFFKKQRDDIYIATVEGYPEIKDIIRDFEEKKVSKITLMPYMLVAGDHAQNDMASEDKDSWKSILESKGFEVSTVLKGLGQFKSYQELYIQKIKEQMV